MQLLEYSTSNIKLEMQVEPGRMEYRQALPTHKLTKTGGKLNMQSAPTRLRLDTYERRASMGLRGVNSQTAYMKQSGYSGAIEAIGNYAQTGNALRDIHKGANIADAYYSKMFDKGSLGFQPLAPVDISWEQGFLKQDYETARLAFDWKTDRGEMKFTPSSVKFNVTQYPSISFKYLGGPIYVPKSADPNYNEAI